MIQIKNLKFSYLESKAEDSSPLIDIQNFEILDGEKVFLFGPSGSGKTTFLELLGGIQAVQEGEIEVHGNHLDKMSSVQLDQWRSEKVGIIFQSFNLIPSLNVLENVLAPNFWRSPEKQIAEKRARELLEQLGMSDFIKKAVYHLSLGQQQRVAAARVLAQQPQIILADEPTSSLDQEAREEFLKILFSLSDRIRSTLVFVSHDRTMGPLFDRQINWLEINLSEKGKRS